MSTTARKARKRAGIKFEKAAKVGTPASDRSFIWSQVLRRGGDAQPVGLTSFSTARSPKRVIKFLKSGGIK